ncbi:hypothetical protein QZH41_011962, partial [Actinostola sp. cb2023]
REKCFRLGSLCLSLANKMAATQASQGSRFAGVKTYSEKFKQPELDQQGRIRKIETREDEEQNVKLSEIIELLLAAGYFRARIKGLSPFDKVVGGMTWCITVCDFDIDVDLLFQENSTIGQKIALTEKIVAVLPRMKCPHRLEPHQIQGLDFINIFPVVQWLVKRAIERKEEMGDYIREFSLSQFNKFHTTPQDNEFKVKKPKCMETMGELKNTYKPKRIYRRPGGSAIGGEEIRVRTTLLEYGWQFGFSKEQREKDKEKAEKKKAAAAATGRQRAPSTGEEDEYLIEQKRLTSLLKGMAAMEGKEGTLSSSTIGSIVELQSEQISQIASEYAERQAELQEGIEGRGERVGGAQAHKRMVASMEKQIAVQGKKTGAEMVLCLTCHSSLMQLYFCLSFQITEKQQQLQASLEKSQEQLSQVCTRSERIDEEMEKLSEMEKGENAVILETLRSLVAMNENLKKQEQQFRTHCKDEMTRLQDSINKFKSEEGEEDSEEKERMDRIDKQYEADKTKLQSIRLLLARKTREIAALQRKIDEVPSRSELSQYQRRFVELYNQVAATHKETKQFFTLYNTLDDSKLYLGKEVNLLNSIHDNFEQAMSSPANKEQFLNQFDQIVKGVTTNKEKVEKKRASEKQRRDGLNDEYLDLVEKQRLYYKTVKDFTE